jgi:serine/threonine protein kinase/Flp pilus assembly protein TadD
MPLADGTQLGRYVILSPLGKGGMGEVYRARDTTLDREVAIKVLPERLVNEPAALKRFEREAKAVAALSHPNILDIHDFGTHNGVIYAVTELLRGETLRETIVKSAIPCRRAVEIAVAVADGLSAAHSKGIIHRDLKPENIFLTSDGHIKILDFGLAQVRPPIMADNLTQEPTISHQTEPGTVIGTLPYMSPEQARGEALDARTDIFSFGCVLYEMLTGQRPFPQKNIPDLLAAILKEDPPQISSFTQSVPVELQVIINTCLEKNPQKRFHSSHDLAFNLRRLIADVSAPPTRWSANKRIRLVMGIAICILAVVSFAGYWWKQKRQTFSSAKIESLAVLPLKNLSGDAQQAYFADGMTEELITELSKISALKVISRTSSMHYKETKKPLRQIATELSVDALIEGSVFREGNEVRVTVQLIQGATDQHMWAESYQREMHGVLALHSEIASAVAREIQAKLTPQEQQQLASARPVNPSSHEAYLKGLYFLRQMTPEGSKKGLEFFRQAVALDKNNALAFAAMAHAYWSLGFFTTMPSQEAYLQAKDWARKAVALDENLAEAHYELAMVLHFFEWNQPAARQEFQRALQLKPNVAINRSEYAYYLCRMGEHERAMTEAKRAQELDPLNLDTAANLAGVLWCSRRYDEAIAQYRAGLELSPNNFNLQMELGYTLLTKGVFEQAISEIKKNLSMSPSNSVLLSDLGIAYARSGRTSQAIQILNALEERRKRGEPIKPFMLAGLYRDVGDKDRALDWLEKGVEERDDWLVWLYVDPLFDPLRSEPRFQAVLKRVGLPEK